MQAETPWKEKTGTSLHWGITFFLYKWNQNWASYQSKVCHVRWSKGVPCLPKSILPYFGAASTPLGIAVTTRITFHDLHLEKGVQLASQGIFELDIGYIYIYMDFRITKKPAKWKQEPLLWPFGATWTKQRSWDICKFGQGSYWLHRVLLLEKHVGCAKSTRYNVWWSCFVQDPSSSWNCVQYYFLEN